MSHTLGPVYNAALAQQLRANGEEEIADLIAQNGAIAQRVLAGDMAAVVHYSPDQLEAILKAANQVQVAAE
jgi:hypothetical protein